MRWRGVGGLMLLDAKGPPLPTIKNGLETLKKASSHRVPWSCMVLVSALVFGLVFGLVLDSGGLGGWVGLGWLGLAWLGLAWVVSVLGLSWVVLGHIKATQGNAQEGEEGAR